MKSIGLLIVIICPLLFVACETTTSAGDPNRHPHQLAVNTRIKQNSERYSKLSSSQKKAVKQGSLSKGMSKEAVRLAWGKPDKIQQVKTSKGKREHWIYLRIEQVGPGYQSSTAAGKLSQYSQYFRGTEKYYDGHSQNQFRSIQVEDRTAVFAGGRVVSWTRTRY